MEKSEKIAFVLHTSAYYGSRQLRRLHIFNDDNDSLGDDNDSLNDSNMREGSKPVRSTQAACSYSKQALAHNSNSLDKLPAALHIQAVPHIQVALHTRVRPLREAA
jgi:hypothetical protein